MIDFMRLAETIKNKVFSRGYTVDPIVLAEKLEEDERRLRSYKSIFATPEGRFVLTDLMIEGGLLSSHDTEHSLILAHREGKRAMAVRIASNLGLSFEQVVQMYSDNPR
ncbi:hypothetical protein HUT03_02135 [Candidatus Liberibacter africanus]|uniref:Bbp19-like phage domain-containing protein n=1 Tax=Candidatus Liberibacter africanus PTSAPSY TaxID=1277257 RepID=A0A0G3I2G4_LIBAF|nr:hypothetical protein [Candidatus Liberibacter africanus]AKK20064.1 hypothetical protein G293_02160 [Candidatus Liberibacter africanus PTSAPSY]QTP63884.1 hypothetical protein HUT03_02135 [Candidatus Liberibacter africanus]